MYRSVYKVTHELGSIKNLLYGDSFDCFYFAYVLSAVAESLFAHPG